MQIRVPPNNIEAEQSIIGGLLLEPQRWDEIYEFIDEEHFYKASHKVIFQAIKELNNKNQNVDILTVSEWLSKKDLLDYIGGSASLAEILNATPTTVNIKSYVDIVVEKALLRRLIQSCQDLVNTAYEEKYDEINSFLDFAESKIFSVTDKRDASGLVSAEDILKKALTRIEDLYNKNASVIGIPSGFKDLDTMTAGFQPGELIILAARPSMGKTALSLNIAAHASMIAKKRVAYFSLEMSREQLMFRVLASEAKVDLSNIRVGKIADSAWPKLINAASTISQAPLMIDDSSGISPYEIRAKCRRLKSHGGLDIIMVDYLQLMDLKQRVESRERAVSEISKTLKGIAKELSVPVIALSQLNRGVEGRSDRRPMLSDLRESGSIEQDADVIMMIYREDYYDKENADNRGIAEVIVAKQRNGPTGVVKLAWLAQHGLFANLAPQSYTPPADRSKPALQQINKTDLPNFAPSFKPPPTNV